MFRGRHFYEVRDFDGPVGLVGPPIANYNYITVLHLHLQERYLGAALEHIDHDENYCTKVHSDSITDWTTADSRRSMFCARNCEIVGRVIMIGQPRGEHATRRTQQHWQQGDRKAIVHTRALVEFSPSRGLRGLTPLRSPDSS